MDRLSSAQFKSQFTRKGNQFVPKQGKQRKYRNKPAWFDGVLYHSQLEADCAATLTKLQKAELVRSWKRQVRLVLPATTPTGRKKVHVVDFHIWLVNSIDIWIDAKGYDTNPDVRHWAEDHHDISITLVHSTKELENIILQTL